MGSATKIIGAEKVRDALRAAIEPGTAAQWAARNRYSEAYVSMVLNGRKRPSEQMARDLGFRCEVQQIVRFTPTQENPTHDQ
jgi:hypothetical protein